MKGFSANPAFIWLDFSSNCSVGCINDSRLCVCQRPHGCWELSSLKASQGGGPASFGPEISWVQVDPFQIYPICSCHICKYSQYCVESAISPNCGTKEVQRLNNFPTTLANKYIPNLSADSIQPTLDIISERNVESWFYLHPLLH